MQRMLFAVAMTAAAVCAPGWCLAGEAEDQDAAQQIAQYLRDSGQMQHYSVGVKFKDGTVWLAGRVTSEEQMQTALQLVSSIQGVTQIVNNLEVGSADAGSASAVVKKKKKARQAPLASGVSQASAQVPMTTGMNGMAIGAPPPLPAPPQTQRVSRTAGNGSRGVPAGYNAMPAGGPVPPGNGYGPGAPTPMPAYTPGTGGGVAPAAYNHPSLPNYSWPSYAAYPNYAAVTYPRQYSATAWPYIGPFYPYPQVPMGWRKVSLEWDDGWWFLDFCDRSTQ